jgi:hypothetical protein
MALSQSQSHHECRSQRIKNRTLFGHMSGMAAMVVMVVHVTVVSMLKSYTAASEVGLKQRERGQRKRGQRCRAIGRKQIRQLSRQTQ